MWAEAELLAVGGDRPLDRESSGRAREGAADGVRCGPGAGTRDRAVTGTGALLSKGGREGEETPWRGLTLPQLGLLGAPSPRLPWGGGGRARPRASGPRALSGTDQLRLRSHEWLTPDLAADLAGLMQILLIPAKQLPFRKRSAVFSEHLLSAYYFQNNRRVRGYTQS